jgi:phosphopantothenate---cysteine ligase (CTP)
MAMNCIVTAGPTCEPLDGVRRLTNTSTGRLAVGLADFLAGFGWEVTLLRSEAATYSKAARVRRCEGFLSTADLELRLASWAGPAVDAVFHVAAVSDFRFGRVYERVVSGELVERREAKLSTGTGDLLVELRPTPKLIGLLRGWYPRAVLVGWKYELDGSREDSIAKARQQITQNRTNGCVVNGTAYGTGYGLVKASTEEWVPFNDANALYEGLRAWVERAVAEGR